MKKYRPSNGSEGDWFINKYCMNCTNQKPTGNYTCKILCDTLCYNTSEPEYPAEWIYDERNEPKCTAFVKWDWDNDGDPDDPNNPKAPPKIAPNQLCLPFELMQIEQGETVKQLEAV
jgi:hypothetical protein